jgi:hypothetical protein
MDNYQIESNFNSPILRKKSKENILESYLDLENIFKENTF